MPKEKLKHTNYIYLFYPLYFNRSFLSLSLSLLLSPSISLSFNIHIIKLWKKKFSSQVSRAWEIIFVIVRTIPLKIIVMLQEATHHKRQPSQTASISFENENICVYEEYNENKEDSLRDWKRERFNCIAHIFHTLVFSGYCLLMLLSLSSSSSIQTAIIWVSFFFSCISKHM